MIGSYALKEMTQIKTTPFALCHTFVKTILQICVQLAKF